MLPIAHILSGYSISQIAILIIVVAAIAAIVMVALRQMQIAIPAWVVQIIWIIVVAFVCVLAIYLLLSLVGWV